MVCTHATNLHFNSPAAKCADSTNPTDVIDMI